MSSGRTLLIGGNGWIGSQLADALPDVHLIPARAILDGSAITVVTPGPHDVIVNAAGLRGGSGPDLYSANVTLVKELMTFADRGGCRIVQLGSAAEYGPDLGTDLSEDVAPLPRSYYGLTKLLATELLEYRGNATVLRVFNLASSPPQEGSPLADVVSRARDAMRHNRPAELLAAATVRDWVSLDFVVRSVERAVAVPVPGIYNLCSARGVSMADLAEAMLRGLGSEELGVQDLQAAASNIVVGDNRRWKAATGLVEVLAADDVARMALHDERTVGPQ
jgi:nucleoside-diphosphate-sugar epimerase